MPLTEADARQIIEKKIFFFDLDGTVYLSNKLFEGVLELFSLIRASSKYLFVLSNNSSKSTDDYFKKLQDLKLNLSKSNIILSQHPTMKFLKDNNYKKIFLLGNSSLKKEFVHFGFELTENDPQALVLAFDQEFDYNRLRLAASFLQSDIPYFATHLDNRCPIIDGYIPDAGGIAALLEKTSDRMPRVFGKPNKEMLLFKLDELNLSREDAIIFGDRLYTDIKMGKTAGISTCCVLSGETTLEMIENSVEKPDFIINGIWELLPFFKRSNTPRVNL